MRYKLNNFVFETIQTCRMLVHAVDLRTAKSMLLGCSFLRSRARFKLHREYATRWPSCESVTIEMPKNVFFPFV